MSAEKLVKRLIEDELGYCCEFAFFTLYRKTALVADRLGVSTRAIKKHKAAVREGCETCSSKPNCLKASGVLARRQPR